MKDLPYRHKKSPDFPGLGLYNLKNPLAVAARGFPRFRPSIYHVMRQACFLHHV
jgi:hypothetical protein